MTADPLPAAAPAIDRALSGVPVRSPWRRAWARFCRHRLALASLVVVCLLAAVAVLAPVVAYVLDLPFDRMDLSNRGASPSRAHIFGTDDAGRDVFIRILYGGRVSLTVALAAACASAILGTAIGVVSGYYGGWIDAFFMRLVDATLSLPILALLIIVSAIDLSPDGVHEMVEGIPGWLVWAAAGAILAVAGLAAALRRSAGLVALGGAIVAAGAAASWLGGVEPALVWLGAPDAAPAVLRLVIVISLFGWMTTARLVRGQVLAVREMEYVEAARALGASPTRLMARHIAPNSVAPVIVATTLEAGAFILYEAVLSFLSLGIQPPVPSWGNMLQDAQQQMLDAPHVAIFPGIVIVIAVSCLNFIGDGLRDALDPRHARGA